MYSINCRLILGRFFISVCAIFLNADSWMVLLAGVGIFGKDCGIAG